MMEEEERPLAHGVRNVASATRIAIEAVNQAV